MNLLLFSLFACIWSCNGMIEHIPLPGGLLDCFSRFSQRTNVVDTVGESIASFCFGQYMWKASRELGLPGFNITREAYEWVQNLLPQKPMPNRHARQAPNLRIRKEYRRLTEVERANFHRAVQLLKADTSVLPSMYDALSAIHQGLITTSAHGGPNFLGFHRVYLLMFENALRTKVPSVTLPYWDSTLDEPLINPTQSILFTDSFFGNGFGMVRTGPFAGWTTLSGPLIRNIGQAGSLFNANDMVRIVSSVRLAHITEPNAPVNSSLEFLHNQVHLWIDGQMGSLDTAAHDPVFWLHHSYVDYIWELFRQNQRRFGIDPTSDYPAFVNNSMHMAMSPMGLGGLRNVDGFGDAFTGMMYQYEAAPTCSVRFPNCGSPYLRCVIRGFRTMCVSVDMTFATRVSFNRQRTINAVMRGQQIQALARLNFMNNARRQRLNLQNRLRISQQQSILAGLQGPPAPIRENENAGLDDASETRQRRSARFVYKEGKPLKDIAIDPRGSSFDLSRMNINSNLQMHVLSKSKLNHEMPRNVQNNTQGVYIPPMVQPDMCSAVPMTQGYQNTFNINGRSDINQWVYIPVKIIYQRPPTFNNYGSYPIVNGEMEAEDIYSPNAFKAMKSAMPMGNPAAYRNCQGQESGVGKVYISSQGMNYMGTYKEYAVVDHRLAISIATAYVAVKSPEFGASQVFLNAYDSCGRICQPFCKLAGSPGFQRCSGAFMVNSKFPKLYGTNYGDAVTHLWQFSKQDRCPIMQDDNIYLQFHCNFKDSWPFSTQPEHVGGSAAHDEHEEPEVPSSPVAASKEPTMAASKACHVGNGCILTSGCNTCIHGISYPCIGSCDLYSTCHKGFHRIQRCHDNTIFDPDEGTCVPGACMNNKKAWWKNIHLWQ